jgi:hypothetical protein
MRNRLVIAAGAALMMTLTATSSVFAGEIAGPPGGGGKPTPIASGVSASLCAFSGLNDYNQGQTAFQTQNYGQDIRLGIYQGPSPSIGCNPTRTPTGG